jgi:hypothetical protein
MGKELSNLHLNIFEQIKQTDENGNEFWMARKLSKALEYTDFRNFSGVISKAKEACNNSGQLVENHIVEANEMVSIGSGAERLMPSYKLSRYACYLIVQNANKTHYEVGKKVRKTIKDLGGEMPENLPAVNSIKKIEKEQQPKKIKPGKKKDE